jgi:hypothetical protein
MPESSYRICTLAKIKIDETDRRDKGMGFSQHNLKGGMKHVSAGPTLLVLIYCAQCIQRRVSTAVALQA